MNFDPVYARAPLRPEDPQSSSPSLEDQHHKRQRSRTLETAFVSTAVVPAPSSTDVLSSLITSLTLLSDSAREQIRSARELDQNISYLPSEPTYPVSQSSFDARRSFSISTERDPSAINISDGEEAEPPAVGYSRSRVSEQKRPTSKEKWTSFGSAKEKPFNMVRSGSSQTMRRPQSGASSHIGMPSIERVHNGSSSSLGVGSAPGTRSPLKMFFSPRADGDANASANQNSFKDAEVKSVKSVKSFRTIRSKNSTKASQDQEKNHHDLRTASKAEQRTPSKKSGKITSYSPLSPANREDLSEHLIPSRRSSMRHSPSRGRGSSKGRSPSLRRNSSLHSKSFSAGVPGSEKAEEGVQPSQEEDSTLRRIRELQQAKEKRQNEWQKESRKKERSGRRSSRTRSKTGADVLSQGEVPVLAEKTESFKQISQKDVNMVDKLEVDTFSAPVVREIVIPSPVLITTPTIPSPALSTPRKHKRSLSVGLRRSSSLRHGPGDDMRSVSEQVEAFLTAPRLTQKIRHPRTGRTIAFSEVGDPDGFAVFCCVGMGLTRFVTSFYDDVARTQRLRLITPDRPGIGESSPFPDNVCAPLAWVDDIAIICQTLNIDKFSLLAHSAGAIFALATALKMPDRVRGQIHLLAPWIPPSQFPDGNTNGEIKAANLPMAHKLLSVLPAPLLRAANSRFLSATSASIEPRSGKGRKKEQYDNLLAEMAADLSPPNTLPADATSTRHSSFSHHATPTTTPPPYMYNNGVVSPPASPSPTNMKRQFSSSARKFRSPTPNEGSVGLTPQARQALFNKELTHRTWALATQNANPAVDLLICLERRRPIGFRYIDVIRSVVIHHGRNDTRVPLDNAQWLSKVMKHCELRTLDDEGHGLMASANVMSRVLGEIGREWEEWAILAHDDERKRRDHELEVEKAKEIERKRFIRQGH